MSVILALLSSLLWGVADFAGGTASRRLPALLVVLASQATGLVAVMLLAVVTGQWDAPWGYLPWAIGAGLVGATGLLAFYRALAIGTMGVVSPIAALSVIIPVVVGLAGGSWPPAVAGVGIVLAVLGVVAAGGPERAAGRSLRPVLMAALAAVCFGSALLFIARGAEHSPVMTMVAMRVASVLALAGIVLARRGRGADARPSSGGRGVEGGDGDAGSAEPSARAVSTPPAGGIRLLVVAAGLFDVSANLVFAVASTTGSLAIVAILGSLYPAVTVLLARALHGERLSRLQQCGVLVALVGVALIAGWS